MWGIPSVAGVVVIIFGLLLLWRSKHNKQARICKTEPIINSSPISVHEIIEQENVQVEVHENIAQTGSEQYSVSDLAVLRIIADTKSPYLGYELLQSLLSAGFRYGDMQIFHRHAQPDGGGPIWYSIASVTEPGSFDIQKMGSFVCKGLTLFMRLDKQKNLLEIFNSMVDTARQLVEDLGGEIWDDRYRIMDKTSINHWRDRIRQHNIDNHSYDLFDV